MYVYGTATFYELKIGQYEYSLDGDKVRIPESAGDSATIVVGDGTNAAALNIHSLQASTSNGESIITIEDGSTMTVDGMRLDTGASLNLIGTARLRIAIGGTIESGLDVISGNGVLGDYEVNTGTGADEGYDVYTAKFCGYDETDARLRGDTNYDCKVNLADFAAIAENWMVNVSLL
jgi:hypothetical protein